jgi:hypothetical protein
LAAVLRLVEGAKCLQLAVLVEGAC